MTASFPADPGPAFGRHHVEQVMGMAVSVDIRDACCPAEAVDEVVAWLHHVDDTFSTHKPESPISALGRGEITLDEVDADIGAVLRVCEDIRCRSEGVFDVFEVPAPNGTTLDPSGLVKGWSIERAAGILERHGCRDFCINAGGDIALRGRPEPASRWRVGIRHPDDPAAFALVIEADGPLGVATSATYERGPHIIDPRIHRPATVVASATVVGPDLTLADAYATVVFIMGLDGLDWIDDQPGYDAYVITHDQRTLWTPGFAVYRSPSR